MRRFKEGILAVVFLTCCAFTLVQPMEVAASEPPDPVAASEVQPAPEQRGDAFDEVAPLMLGQLAPFNGILLSEARFQATARMRLRIDELEGMVANRDRQNTELATRLGQANAAAVTINDPGWWSRNGVTVGYVLGVVSAGLAVWGAVEVLGTAAD